MDENKTSETNFIEPNYKKDTIANTISNLTFLFCLWLMSFLLPKLSTNGFADAGIFTICLSISNICTAVNSYGISSFFSSDVKRKYKSSIFVYFSFTTTGISLLLSLILCLVYGYNSTIIGCVLLYYVFKACDNITLVLRICLQREGKMYLYSYSLFIRALLSLGVFSLSLWLSQSLFISMLCLAILGVLYLTIVDMTLVRKKCPGAFKICAKEYKISLSMFYLIFPVFVYGFCFAIIPSIPRLIYENITGNQTLLGYFGTMSSITVLIQAATTSLILPFIPKLSKSFKDGKYTVFGKTFLGMLIAVISLTVIAFVLVCFLGDWALNLVYGSEILEYSSIFKWIVLATGLQSLVIVFGDSTVAIDRKLYLIVASVAGSIIMVSLSTLFIKQFDMMGLVYIYYISYGTTLIILASVLLIVFIKLHKSKKQNAETITE